MQNLKNSVQLIGNIGAEPEFQTLDSGQKLFKSTLATNERYKTKDGEQVDKTHWHNLIAWGRTAELMHEFLEKGSEVIVKGKLEYNSYENKEGQKIKRPQVVVNDFKKFSKTTTKV